MGIKDIEFIIMDVDGVLTDGSFAYLGQDELKFFHVRDGLGLTLARLAGIKLAFLTGRESENVRRRARELGIDYCRSGVADKKTVMRELSAQSGIEQAKIGYIGDDFNDLPAMAVAGWSATVNNAPEAVKKQADYISPVRGGKGAVREVIEQVLQAQNLWERTLQLYLEEKGGSGQ